MDTGCKKEPNNRFEIRNLENEQLIIKNSIENLTRRIEILEILVGKIAQRSGIKVESFPNGLVVIVQDRII